MAMKRILAIRIGRSGDIVMITAALKALLKKYPDAVIDVLTSLDGKRLLSGFDKRLNVRYVHERKSLFEYFKRKKIINQIKEEHYDVVYCFELKSSFSQFYQNIGSEIFQLGHTDKIINYAQRCLELVCGTVDSNNEHEWIWLPVIDPARQKTNKMLEDVGISNKILVIGFHPSFSGLRKSWFRSQGHREEKAWPVENFGALAIALDKYAKAKQLDLAIIMDLVEEDRELGEAIVKASNGIVKLFVPPLNFDRYKATLERMNVLVVPNTGPMHIAGAVGTNLIALFGGLDPADSAAYVNPEKIIAISPESSDENKVSVATIHPDVVFAACQKFI